MSSSAVRAQIEPVLGVQGVTRIRASAAGLHSPAEPSASSGEPKLAIVGAIHGNEHCGLSAITRLQTELASGALELARGTLFLVHGNPAATEQRLRHTSSGRDLNRMFDYRFVDELAPTLWEREHHRAIELRPVFEQVDAVLDLHSTTAPTPPFAIASRVPASEPFALALGLEYVTTGWDGPDLLGDQVLLAQLTRRELPGVAVECGQHDEPGATEIAYRSALRALSYFGMLGDHASEPAPPCKRLVIRAAIKRPSATFRFERPLHGMQTLGPGDVIGHGDHLLLSVRNPCYVVMPNDQVAVGDDLLYIAEELTPR
jgi:uncharacterized protein